MNGAPAPLVALKGARVGYAARCVLDAVDLEIRPGERIAILGRSGAGKSTLLNLLHDILRAEASLIPQNAGLVPQLSTFHNVYMGRLDRYGAPRNLRMLLWPDRKTLEEVAALLDTLDLTGTLRQRAGALSGGQAQRTSIARALYGERQILIADEPVSALDRSQGARVLRLLATSFKTSVVALHDVGLALDYATRVLVLRDGGLALDAPAATLTPGHILPLYQDGI